MRKLCMYIIIAQIMEMSIWLGIVDVFQEELHLVFTGFDDKKLGDMLVS